MSETLGTTRLPYRLLRDTVSTADQDLTASTSSWATFKSVYHPISGSAKIAIPLSEADNRAVICFDFKNNNDEVIAVIYAYRQGFPAEFVCSTTGITAGTQISDGVEDARGVATVSRYFGQAIGSLTQAWIGGSSSVEVVDASSANRVSKIKFDTYGYSFIMVLFTTISGTDNVRAWISFY